MNTNILLVARLGKAVGLKGEVKLFIESDFPEQFTKGATFVSSEGKQLLVKNIRDGAIHFEGFSTPEEARVLTGQSLFLSVEETKKRCQLSQDEYLWIDIIGCSLVENGEILGEIIDIERLTGVDMLLIKTTSSLVEKKYASTFLFPFTSRTISTVVMASKTVNAVGAWDILEAS